MSLSDAVGGLSTNDFMDLTSSGENGFCCEILNVENEAHEAVSLDYFIKILFFLERFLLCEKAGEVLYQLHAKGLEVLAD